MRWELAADDPVQVQTLAVALAKCPSCDRHLLIQHKTLLTAVVRTLARLLIRRGTH